MGRWPEAVEHYHRALGLDPGYADAYFNLGLTLADAGQMRQAVACYEQALRLQPNPVMFPACDRLAWYLATRDPAEGGNAADALRLAGRLDGLTGRSNVYVLDTLAAAYASADRFPEAVAAAQAALRLAQDRAPANLAPAIAARLALYRAGQRYRAPALPPPTQPATAP
jgi:tetratricopeptide (TPR) repeat protein